MDSVLSQNRLGLCICNPVIESKNGGQSNPLSRHTLHSRINFTRVNICRKNERQALVVAASENDKKKPGSGKGPSVDWDNSWKSFKTAQKKGPFQFMEKYVSRSPQQSNFPMAEELDPFRRTEKTALNFWTNPKFTYAGFGVIFALFLYMVVIVGPPPSH